MENKGSNVRYNKINITFPDMVIVENIIPRNMIINLGCASVDNHIPRDDIFDYHHIREGNIYIMFTQTCMGVLHETRDSLDVEHSTRENQSFRPPIL